jgi:acyl-CoA thioesterase-1
MLNIRHYIGPIVLICPVLLAACHDHPAPSLPDSTQTPAPTQTMTKDSGRTIIFFGNSLTAGYGLQPDESFPARIGHRLDSLHKTYKIVKAGISGETTSGGKSRIAWILRQPADIFVLELGGNDGLRGIPVTTTRDNLQSIIDTVKSKYPKCKILLVGMRVPPSMGSTYAIAFHDIFVRLAEKNKIPLIPFLLEGVGGDPSLNQADGIHPNTAGEKIVTETVWKALQPLLI